MKAEKNQNSHSSWLTPWHSFVLHFYQQSNTSDPFKIVGVSFQSNKECSMITQLKRIPFIAVSFYCKYEIEKNSFIAVTELLTLCWVSFPSLCQRVSWPLDWWPWGWLAVLQFSKAPWASRRRPYLCVLKCTRRGNDGICMMEASVEEFICCFC